LCLKIYRAAEEDATALGVAYLAGLKIGVYKSLNDISKNWKFNRKFLPKIKNKTRKNLIKGWSQAVSKTLNY
jgi:glycerol kinase